MLVFMALKMFTLASGLRISWLKVKEAESRSRNFPAMIVAEPSPARFEAMMLVSEPEVEVKSPPARMLEATLLVELLMLAEDLETVRPFEDEVDEVKLLLSAEVMLMFS